ncbi:glycosyltransferase family 2 protein [Verrucomicrobiota bacterium]
MKKYKLVVMMPALNEGKTIESVIRQMPEEVPGIKEIVVLVVDDGSTDNTSAIAEGAGAVVVSHNENHGVGKAYATGLDYALKHGADIIVNIDSDGQFDSKDIPELIKPITDGKAEFVTASRFIDKSIIPKMTFARLWGNKAMSLVISKIVGRRFYDVSCGFRACSREAALRLNLSGAFTYTQETFLDLAAKGIHIVEIPMVVLGTRKTGKSRVASNLWKYGHRASRIIIKAYKDYWPWQFFSSVALGCFAVSFALGGFLLYWRITHHKFSPHIWAGFVAGFFFVVGTLSVLMGMAGDMLKRIRLNVEQLLYFQKKQYYDELNSSDSEV